jgi:hypothetical protein
VRAAFREHPHVWAAVALGLVVFAYLWPVLVGGRIFSPIADLYYSVPWQAHAPADVRHFQNPTLIDVPLAHYPWRVLVRQLLHAGVLPAWNPYALGGIPLYANPQTGVFSLVNVPLWILPLNYGLSVSAALKLGIGAFGSYLLARELRLGFLAGLLAGVTFAFSAVNVTWIAAAEQPAVLMMLPWALLLVERILAGGRLGYALALAIVTAVALGGGHPGMQVHFLAVVALYVLLRAVWPQQTGRGERTLAVGLVGGALVVAVLLMAFVLIPEARSSHDTVGVVARQQELLPGQRLPLDALQTVVFPDRWGRPSAIENVTDVVHNPFRFANYNERTFYAGVVALLLACVALLARGAWARKGPFLVLGVVGLAVPLHAPGLYWAATHLPVLELVEPQRIHFAYALAAAMLGAFGLQALLDAPQERRRLLVPLLALSLGTWALVTTGASAQDVGDTVRHFVSGTDYESGGVLALTSIVWFLLFALAVGAALLAVSWRPRWRTAVVAALVALAVVDALHFAHGYTPMGPASKVVPPKTPAVAYLQRHRDEGRVVGIEAAFPADSGVLYGVRDVRGYDPPQPTRRLLALWRRMSPAQESWMPLRLTLADIDDGGALRILGVLGARYVVIQPDFELARGAQRLRTVYAGHDATILENAYAIPRAFVPRRVVSVHRSQAGRRIVEPGFDPTTAATVEVRPGDGDVAAGRGSVSLAQERNARITLHADLTRGGLVVLDDALMDGWSVTVDGRPSSVLRADEVMRGVVVPAGEHEVVWSYAVPGLRAGAIVSALTALGLLVAAGLLVRGRRRASTRALVAATASRG